MYDVASFHSTVKECQKPDDVNSDLGIKQSK